MQLCQYPSQSRIRRFTLEAIQIPIVYNQYGDPAPPILRAYVGDPAKIRLVHGGIKETHVFHLHNHQWRLEGEILFLRLLTLLP